MKKTISIGIVLTLVLTVVSGIIAFPGLAGTEFYPDSYPLYAGQDIDVGTVEVWNDGDSLHVTYKTTGGWEMTETHLSVGCNLEDIPQTKKGNPIPGHFEFATEHDPAMTEYTYEVSLLECEGLFIAAHAVVQKVVTEAPYYAASIVDYSQGLTKGGSSVRAARSVPSNALYYETGRDESNFFSLGFGGWMILEFDCPIANGEGNDIKVIEDTWGGGYPLEEADVYASQDGIEWVYLGTADNTNLDIIHTISEFDLGELEWAKYVKVVDVTDPTPHNNAADAYDLNAVQSLQDCVEIETAWGATEVGQMPFPGNNWATYFQYTLHREVLFEEITVFANPDDGPTSLSSCPLEDGKQYRIEASGTYYYRDITLGTEFQLNSIADAEWALRPVGDPYNPGLTPIWVKGDTEYPADKLFGLDLQINGPSTNTDWGSYQVDNVYSIPFIGTGSSLTFSIFDGHMADNSGHLTVKIFE